MNDGRTRAAVELSRGEVDVDVSDRGCDFVDADAADGECGGINLHADRGARLAENHGFGHAVDRGQFSDQQVFDVLIDDAQRQRL